MHSSTEPTQITIASGVRVIANHTVNHCHPHHRKQDVRLDSVRRNRREKTPDQKDFEVGVLDRKTRKSDNHSPFQSL
jgi:hypothetical protein